MKRAAPPARRRRRVFALACAVPLLLLAACQGSGGAIEAGSGYVSGDGTVTTWERGERPGPVELSGKDTDGEPVSTTPRGDVIVLNFWQAACPPCRAEAADLAALHQEFASRGVRFYGINGTDSRATASAFERTYRVPYPTLLDTDSQATAALQGVVAVRAVPTTIVLDGEGRVAARVLGRIDPSIARTLIADTLAEGGQ